MARITNREDFKDSVMRRLGWPVQQINVTDDQIEDRIEDALDFYRDYHYDATEKVLLRHEITAQNVAQGYIEFPDIVQGINRVIPGSGVMASNWMTPQYQITLDAVTQLHSKSLIPYHIAMSHLQELNFMFDMTPSISFNRHKNRLYLLGDSALKEHHWIVVEATRYLDPDEFEEVWNDRWLKRYAYALVKKQWGENIKTFTNVQLLGGVTLDGQTIWQEADSEIQTLEQEIIHSFGANVFDRIG